MDRQAFLDGQLWLRRLDPEEFEWPNLEIASTRTVHRILPRAYRSEGENSVLQTEGVCWGSFEVVGKFCFFRVDNDNEDQTQMQVELLYVCLDQSASEKVVLVRFGQSAMFELDVHSIQTHRDVETKDDASGRALPPFMCLDMGPVGLRLWLEPTQVDAGQAVNSLRTALLQLQELKVSMLGPTRRVPAFAKSWRESFRHNEWIRRKTDSQQQAELSPHSLLERGNQVMSSDADRRVLSTAINNILRARRSTSCDESDHENIDQQESSKQDDVVSRPLNPSEEFHLVTELVRTLGDDHYGLRALLGLDMGQQCASHDACVELEATVAQTGTESTRCVSSRWQSWDHYLQQTETTFTQIGERTRVCSPQAGQNALSSHADAIQLAAEAFNQSFLGADASRSSKIALDKATQALKSYESLAFSQLFPPQRTFNPAKKRRTKSMGQVSPADAENVWNFLLESRRALLRQALTVACLPHKKGSVTTRPNS